MKKKGLVVQSLVMLVLAVLMLTVASFAWFASGDPSVQSFDVKIVDATKVDVKFFIKQGGDFVEVVPSASFVFFTDTMFPGKKVEVKVQITNRGKGGKLSLWLFDTNYTLTGEVGEKPADILNRIDNELTISRAYSANYDATTPPTLPPTTIAPDIHILTELGIPTPKTKDVFIIPESNVTLEANKVIDVFYTFALSTNLTTFNGIFSLSTKGIKINVG